MSNIYFKQTYYIDYTYQNPLGYNNSPLLVYLGGEAPIEKWLMPDNGIVTMAAKRLNALIIFIEHRFYGKSIPFGSIDLALSNQEVRGCFTSMQALADSAKIIQHIKVNLSYSSSPVIVIGGSYAGMLAAWLRMIYPHVVIGALASSAPILRQIDIPFSDQFCSIASKDFKDTNQKCYDNIQQSWKKIDDMASKPRGLDNLTQLFKSCSPLSSVNQLKGYLTNIYEFAAQYDGRYQTSINLLCKEIAKSQDDNILNGISQAVSIINGIPTCNSIEMLTTGGLFVTSDLDSSKAWEWQVCSELLPPEECATDTMFVPHKFNLTKHLEDCRATYGVYPRPDWIDTYYGGQDIKSAFKSFRSNIIFSNGLRDPWSGAGILRDISDTIVAITTTQGSHCLDLNPVQDNDPDWLNQQREEELKILSSWINSALSSRIKSNNIWPIIIVVPILVNLIY